MTVHFLQSSFSPFALSAVCVSVCACVLSPPSIFTDPCCVCISRNWSPFTPVKHIYAAYWPGFIDLRLVGSVVQHACVCVCVCVCVCSIPPPASCLSPLVISLIEARSRAAGNQSSVESNLTERHPMKGRLTLPLAAYTFTYYLVVVDLKNHITRTETAGADRCTSAPSISAVTVGHKLLFDEGGHCQSQRAACGVIVGLEVIVISIQRAISHYFRNLTSKSGVSPPF